MSDQKSRADYVVAANAAIGREERAASEALLEQLAAIEHERWADWQRYMHSKCIPYAPPHPFAGGLMIPVELVRHWERQIATPYAELTEAEKESDREQVRRYLHLVEAKQKD